MEISNIYKKPLLSVDDFNNSEILYNEKEDTKGTKSIINIFPYTKDTSIEINKDIISTRKIIKIKDCYMVNYGLFDKHFNIYSYSVRRRIENKKNILLTSPKDDIIIPYTGSKYVFFKKKVRTQLYENIKKNNILYIDETIFYFPIYKAYGHFLFETLGRFWVLDHIPIKKLISNIDNKKWVLDLIKPFGFYEKDIIFANNVPIKIEKLIYSSQISTTGRFFSKDIFNIFKKITNYYEDTSKKYYDKIYLSRKNIHKRSLINENEVEEIFIKHGYTIIYPELLSIRKQINIILNANHIAGPIGSQIHNILFSTKIKNPHLLILAPEDFDIKNYLLINHAYNISNNFIFGKKIKDGDVVNTDWSINIAFIEKYLKSLNKK